MKNKENLDENAGRVKLDQISIMSSSLLDPDG